MAPSSSDFSPPSATFRANSQKESPKIFRSVTASSKSSSRVSSGFGVSRKSSAFSFCSSASFLSSSVSKALVGTRCQPWARTQVVISRTAAATQASFWKISQNISCFSLLSHTGAPSTASKVGRSRTETRDRARGCLRSVSCLKTAMGLRSWIRRPPPAPWDVRRPGPFPCNSVRAAHGHHRSYSRQRPCFRSASLPQPVPAFRTL